VAAGVIDTGGKFAAGVNDTDGKLPLVSTTPLVNFPTVPTSLVANNGNDIRPFQTFLTEDFFPLPPISPRIFEKICNSSNKVENLVAVPLKE
jgi:hypothetical protein